MMDLFEYSANRSSGTGLNARQKILAESHFNLFARKNLKLSPADSILRYTEKKNETTGANGVKSIQC